MKKRLFTILLTFTLAVSMCACGGNNGSTDTDKTSTNSETASATEEKESDADVSSVENSGSFSGDWTVVEDAGYSPFFLKYGLNGLEVKDLSDVKIDDSFTLGEVSDLSKVLSKYNYFVVADRNDEYFRGGTADDLINYEGRICTALTDDTVTLESKNVYCYKDAPADEETFETADLELAVDTNDQLTWKNIVALNIYETGLISGSGKERPANVMLNIDADADPSDFRNTMSDIVAVLGKPDHVYAGVNGPEGKERRDSDETFAETVQIGGGTLVYYLVYERDNYNIQITVSEKCKENSYEGSATFTLYVNKDVNFNSTPEEYTY